MLRQELQLRLKVNLNLLLRNQVEILLHPVQELEQILKEEKESNPFIEEVSISEKARLLFEDRRYPEIRHHPHPIETLIRNVKAEMEGRELEIALDLVSSTDGRGFFTGDVREIAIKFGTSPEEVERIRQAVMRCEPIGVCSKDFMEFARLQIEDMYPDEPELLKELEKALSGKGVSESARAKLRHLRTSPIEESVAVPRVAKVDAVIELDDGKLVGYVYEDMIEIKPSRFYRELLATAKGEAREFLREYLDRYENFRKILNIRRENLRKILDEIIRVQEEFLKGEGELKTLMVKDVAGKLGVSESTVSRLINSKYVKTPQGTYPFRFFFVRETAGGISQEQLMRRIREIIGAEDRSRPLSDEEIARILRQEGYNLARRTVSKYRELLGIPPSRERKRR